MKRVIVILTLLLMTVMVALPPSALGETGKPSRQATVDRAVGADTGLTHSARNTGPGHLGFLLNRILNGNWVIGIQLLIGTYGGSSGPVQSGTPPGDPRPEIKPDLDEHGWEELKSKLMSIESDVRLRRSPVDERLK